MGKKPYYISICSQKGGVGKSTFTVLAASILHYRFGRRVLVADCDYPQWSIHEQRLRELDMMEKSNYYKLAMIRQYKATQQKIWPVLNCMATTALDQVDKFLMMSEESYDYVLFDLPGTTATKGVLTLIASLERVFIPMKADKMIMESTITFARMLGETFLPSQKFPMQGVYLFWSMIDKRERTVLYDQYEEVMEAFGLQVMDTHIPQRSRFSKELQVSGGPVYRSTLFPAERAFESECCLDVLCREICLLTEGK